MTDLPIYLQKLDALPSALDIIRFLHNHSEGSADLDEICDVLGITERRFRKANRRLVTTGFLQMRSDYSYELTQKGVQAAEELAEYDSTNPPQSRPVHAQKIQRPVLLALPYSLIAGHTSPVVLAFPPDDDDTLNNAPADLVLRLSALNADLNSDGDELIQLDDAALERLLQITPHHYDTVRLRLEVFQLAPGGEDVHPCGGMYVDVSVSANGEVGRMVAWRADLELLPTA